MGVLHSLDVLIGFGLSMAVLAMLVGTATATWLTLARTRARQFESALTVALHNVSADFPAELARILIMDRVVKPHTPWSSIVNPMDWPLVGPLIRLIRSYAPETIHREELALLLLRRAQSGGLKIPGVDDPAATLRNVEQAILAAEVNDPGLPAQFWRTKALQQHASQIAAPLFAHYDNLMDRVEDNIRASSKLVSLIAAAVFLYFAPVDSLQLLDRLSSDAQFRTEMVSVATEVKAARDKGQPVDNTLLAKAEKALEERQFIERDGWRELAWPPPKPSLPQPGVILTWALLSLGAPFWLGLLDKLLGLRSMLAQRGREQRGLRDQDLRAPASSRVP